jgi:hypothetical protein
VGRPPGEELGLAGSGTADDEGGPSDRPDGLLPSVAVGNLYDPHADDAKGWVGQEDPSAVGQSVTVKGECDRRRR